MNRIVRLLTLALAAFVFTLTTGCPSTSSKQKVGAYNPSSTDANLQSAWFIDPQNLSGCATDNPQTSGTAIWGTSATCTGSNGPLASWYGLNTQRWNCGTAGTGCPRLRQNTTITFLSSHTSSADPVYFKPLIENGAIVVLQGTLPTAAAVGTTATVTAKNRATPTLLKSTFTLTAADGGVAPTLAAGQLIVNATHPSRSWIYTVGSPNAMTTPLVAESTSSPSATPAEVTTWANGDAVTIYQPVSVNIAELSPTLTDLNQSTFQNPLTVYQLNVFDPGLATFDQVNVGGSGMVQFLEVSSVRSIAWNPSAANAQSITSPIFANCFLTGGETLTASAAANFSFGRISGGAITGGISHVAGETIDGDTIIAGTSVAVLGGNLGTVYVDTGKTLTVSGGVGTTNNYNSSTPVIWGPGTLNVSGSGRLQYPAGASKAAATLTTTTLQLNGGTKYLTVLPTSATGIVTGNTTLTAAALDTSFGTTSGCAMATGAFICNAGP